MNTVSRDPNFEYIEIMLKTETDCKILHRTSDFDERIKVWMMFGGDNKQNPTLAGLEQIKKMKFYVKIFKKCIKRCLKRNTILGFYPHKIWK